MCGISGFLWSGNGSLPIDAEQRLWRMIAMLRHRGPDDTGVWSDNRCGVAHARLSIIDLSPAGHQPITNADGRIWIIFNGEIYNSMELRAELEAKGYVFRSRSDTEVIIHGYDAWGERVIERLRGIFALALWDKARRRFLLARDRFGKKPLYCTRAGDLLLFGPENESLLTWSEVACAPEYEAIDEFLTLQYIRAPRTAFAGICKLRGAHYLVVEPAQDALANDLAPVCAHCCANRVEKHYA